jgi:hypothetical protein
VTDPLIVEHYGRVVSTAGDSILAELPSAVEAVSCAIEIQGRLAQENVDLPPDRQMRFRIGINLGDVIVDGADVDGSCPPWRLAQCAAKSAMAPGPKPQTGRLKAATVQTVTGHRPGGRSAWGRWSSPSVNARPFER